MKKTMNVYAVRNVSGVAVKRKKSEPGTRGRNPPGVKLCAVVCRKPNVFHRKSGRMPVAREARRKVWEENEVRFENS